MGKTITYIISILIVTTTIVCIIAPNIGFVNRLSEYTVHIMFGMLFIGLVGLLIDNKRLLMVSFMCTGLLALFLKEASNTELKYPDKNELSQISLAHFNLSNLSHDLKDVLSVIEKSNPDIITFQEYTPEWTSVIEQKIKKHFEHSRMEVRIDPFGMAVFSKYPLNRSNVVYYNKTPNLKIKLIINESPLNLLLSYVLPPVLDQKSQTTKDHLSFIGDEIVKDKVPTILFGDFNMVYWSSEILDFRNKFHLKNSRKESTSFGLSIPYDHMFYTNELECTSLVDLNNSEGGHIGIFGVFQHMDINFSRPQLGFINTKYLKSE